MRSCKYSRKEHLQVQFIVKMKVTIQKRQLFKVQQQTVLAAERMVKIISMDMNTKQKKKLAKQMELNIFIFC